jgi:hypothetical protein
MDPFAVTLIKMAIVKRTGSSRSKRESDRIISMLRFNTYCCAKHYDLLDLRIVECDEEHE